VRRIAACLFACLSIVIVYLAAPVGATTATASDWSAAQVIPELPAALATASNPGSPVGISCPSAGNCTAIAQAQVIGTPVTANVYVASQAGGAWGDWQAVPGASALSDFVTGTTVSCPSAGNCTVVGEYQYNFDDYQMFAADESNGVWSNAAAVAGMVSVNGLSCWSAGNCIALGTTEPASAQAGTVYPAVATETGGAWGNAEPIAGITFPSAAANGTLFSCDAAGNCAAVWNLFSGNFSAVVATDADGTWSGATQIQGVSALPSYYQNVGFQATSLGCAPAGGCTVAGTYGEYSLDSFAVTESGGAWGNAVAIPGTASMPTDSNQANPPVELSCPSTGNCSAAGATWVASQKSGTWAAAKAIAGLTTIDPGLANNFVDSISCGAAGDCSLIGDANGTAFVADQAGGAWGPAQALSVPSGYTSEGNLISCATALDCTTLDDATVAATAQAPAQWVYYSASKSIAPVTTVKLAVSAAKLTYGDEQGETITATVSGNGSAPTGTVTVTTPAGGPLCTITLANGTGRCALAKASLPAGTNALTGTYSGDATYKATTATATVTVAPAATVTRLAFTPQSISFAGADTALAVTGSVSSTAGTPNGWVTVRVDGKALSGCTNVAFTGAVSCKGTTAVLAPGKHLVSLAYSARGDFAASTSSSLPLTVAKRGTTTTLTLAKTTITDGQENAEKLTVSLSHVGDYYPTGNVAIKIGGTTICTIGLKKGTGGCTLSKTRLKAGGYTLVASYGGSTDYSGSTSAKKGLTVRG
jgi:hypothetical protein